MFSKKISQVLSCSPKKPHRCSLLQKNLTGALAAGRWLSFSKKISQAGGRCALVLQKNLAAALLFSKKIAQVLSCSPKNRYSLRKRNKNFYSVFGNLFVSVISGELPAAAAKGTKKTKKKSEKKEKKTESYEVVRGCSFFL